MKEAIEKFRGKRVKKWTVILPSNEVIVEYETEKKTERKTGRRSRKA